MPGTNVRLHMLQASYMVKIGLSLDATLHLMKRLLLARPGNPNNWLFRLHLAAIVGF